MEKRILSIEDSKELLYQHYNHSKKMVNILYTKDRPSLINKIKLVGTTLGSSFKLRTKSMNSANEIVLDILMMIKKNIDIVHIICVPESEVYRIQEQLPPNVKVYFIVSKEIYNDTSKNSLTSTG